MPPSELRLIKRCLEFLPQKNVMSVPPYTRGIYVLYKYRPKRGRYDVMYIGMAGGEKAGMRGRLKRHKNSKKGKWTHFSIFEVWENIRGEEVRELEGLFRHIYSKDTQANRLNKQKSFKKLSRIQRATEKEHWMEI